MKLKLALAVILVSLFSFAAFELYTSGQHQRILSSEVKVETTAFNAVRNQTNWIISLEQKHFPDAVKSIAVTYNDTFYGVFLLSDKIYLPVLVADETDLILSLLDGEGNPIFTPEVFIMGKSHVIPKIP